MRIAASNIQSFDTKLAAVRRTMQFNERRVGLINPREQGPRAGSARVLDRLSAGGQREHKR